MWWCWHKWGKWEIAQANIGNIIGKYEYEASVQKRQCQKCGKIQVEKL